MSTAQKSRSLFRLTYEVTIDIQATPETIWGLLTSAADFPRWNNTIQEIQGNIRLGETLHLKAKISGDRVFTPKVSQFEAPRLMVWQDGNPPFFQGVRRFELSPQGQGQTRFHMSETFSGLMLPMAGMALPDFRPSFEEYAANLKAAAEK